MEQGCREVAGHERVLGLLEHGADAGASHLDVAAVRVKGARPDVGATSEPHEVTAAECRRDLLSGQVGTRQHEGRLDGSGWV
jgi:hypothetical protein